MTCEVFDELDILIAPCLRNDLLASVGNHRAEFDNQASAWSQSRCSLACKLFNQLGSLWPGH